MSKAATKALIDEKITGNGVQAITGPILNNVLNTMVDDYGTQEELSQLSQKVDDVTGVAVLANGSNGNTGNANLVHTSVISTRGARYAVIHTNRPNASGCHYAFGFAITSSKSDIGITNATYQWAGNIKKVDVTSGATNPVLDLTPYPTAVGVSFTIGEFAEDGTLQQLRTTDFTGYDVTITSIPGIDSEIDFKLHKELWGVDILSFDNQVGYYNGSGTQSLATAYRTCFIDKSYFTGHKILVGDIFYIHFFDSAKNWISCYVNYGADRIYSLNYSDIPASCTFVAICYRAAVTYLKMFDYDEYLATQRLEPFYPYIRGGSARYATSANVVSTAMIFPAYGATYIRCKITKSAGTGYHYEMVASLYTTVSRLASNSVAINKASDRVSGDMIEQRMDGYEGVTFTINKVDAGGVAQTIKEEDFSLGDVIIERIYTPGNLIPILDNNAYIRNRDKEAMLAAAVRANKTANDSMDFMSLIVTDSHGDAVSESNAVVMADNFPFVQSLLHLGDFCGNKATDFDSSRYNLLLGCKKPFYYIAGNHDVGNSRAVADCITNAQYYTRYVQPIVNAGLLEAGEYTSGKGYYYHDFTSKKIRLIVIYEYDDPNDLDPNDNTKYRYRRGDSVISQAQAQWFCDTLNSTPADYGIIVAMHNPFSSLADCVTTAKFNDPAWTSGYGSQRLFSTDLWADIVNAWVNKSANYTCTMVCTGDAAYLNTGGVYYTFSYDFSSRANTAKFICFIGGHVHRDCVWRHRTYTYQYQITPICSNSTYQQSIQADIRRTNTDGLAKDSLTAIGYDYDNQAIRLVKLGVNVTSDMTARDYELIETQE